MKFAPPQNIAKQAKKTATLLRRDLRNAAIAVLFAIFCIGVSLSQNSAPSAPDRSDILRFVDQTINWYRQIDVERQIAAEPNDIIAVTDDRPLADQIVRSAFEFARAEADLAPQASTKPNQAQNPEGARYQSLLQLAEKLDQQIKQTRAELQSDRQKLEASNGKKRQELAATVAELQSEIDLDDARRDTIRNMADFVGGASSSGLGTSGLRGQIDALARTVSPEMSGST